LESFKNGNPFQQDQIFQDIWQEGKDAFPHFSQRVQDYNGSGDVKSFIKCKFYDSENTRKITNMCAKSHTHGHIHYAGHDVIDFAFETTRNSSWHTFQIEKRLNILCNAIELFFSDPLLTGIMVCSQAISAVKTDPLTELTEG